MQAETVICNGQHETFGEAAMTRTEFDRNFAATRSNTEGFSDAALSTINDAVFATVAELDLDDAITFSHVRNMFDRQFNNS